MRIQPGLSETIIIIEGVLRTLTNRSTAFIEVTGNQALDRVARTTRVLLDADVTRVDALMHALIEHKHASDAFFDSTGIRWPV